MGEIGEAQPVYEIEKPGEACGVFGVYAPGRPLAEMTYLGLQALQHRGQEAAGIAVSNGADLMVIKDTGKVDKVFPDSSRLNGFPEPALLASGHVRYGTLETSDPFAAAQPTWYQNGGKFLFATSHNGHVNNTLELGLRYDIDGGKMASDSDLMSHVIGHHYERSGEIGQALKQSMPEFRGAFSLVVMTPDKLVGVRDAQGFRPLMIGEVAGGGWILASERSALDINNANFVRDIEPGEMVVIDENGLRSEQVLEPAPALCAFEYVYFSRPDNVLYGENVQETRTKMGELLALRHPANADIVVGVPDSGADAALGYASQSGIPLSPGLVKNRYVDRTFIKAIQAERERAVRMKLNPNRAIIEGKSLVVVDDSIVRGTTTRTLVRMLKAAGASEVHLRISSPPYKWPCFYGMDTGRREELLAANMTQAQMCDYIEADSIGFLEADDLRKAVGAAAGKVCMACMTGEYPTDIDS